MTTLVVDNVPDDLYEKLRRQASRNRRSINEEAVILLEQGLTQDPASRRLSPPVKLHGGHSLTIEEIESAIADGQE